MNALNFELPEDVWHWYTKNYTSYTMEILLESILKEWADTHDLILENNTLQEFSATVVGYLTVQNDLSEAISLGLSCFEEKETESFMEEEPITVFMAQKLLENYKMMKKPC